MAKDPLELESRRRLYELVAGTPGLHLRELARLLDVDVRTALYHLQHLERHGLIGEVEEGRYKRYFPKTTNGRSREIVDARDKPVLSLLRKRIPLAVTLALLTKRSSTHADLLEHAPVAPSTLSYHLGKMARAGILDREGAEYRLREPSRVATLLYTHRPTQDLIDEFVDLWEDFTL
jgi:predicted transcriptional regulator